MQTITRPGESEGSVGEEGKARVRWVEIVVYWDAGG